MPADWMPAAPLALFEVRYLCVGGAGVRLVWAPDGDAARGLVMDRASLFGLPESVVVTGVVEVEIREEGLDAA